jgi:hypothetical protein
MKLDAALKATWTWTPLPFKSEALIVFAAITLSSSLFNADLQTPEISNSPLDALYAEVEPVFHGFLWDINVDPARMPSKIAEVAPKRGIECREPHLIGLGSGSRNGHLPGRSLCKPAALAQLEHNRSRFRSAVIRYP